MRNGEKLRNLAVPMERRTLAPTPSDCSMARKACRIARETDISEIVDAALSKDGGITGRPSNVAKGARGRLVVLLVRKLPGSGVRS